MSSKDEIRIGGIAVRYLVEGHESNNTVAMFEFDVAPGGKVPGPHSHDGYEETAYGLEGVLTFTVEGKVTEIGPGQVLVIPRWRRASLRQLSSHHRNAARRYYPRDPRPSYFREVADLLRASAGGPPDLASLGQIMHRHGLTPAT